MISLSRGVAGMTCVAPSAPELPPTYGASQSWRIAHQGFILSELKLRPHKARFYEWRSLREPNQL